jgi:hypothetical protein
MVRGVRKNLRSAGDGSVLTESDGEGGPGGWMLHGGRAEEREGERGALGAAVACAGGALPRDSGGQRGRRDAVDAADRLAGARWGPNRQRLGAVR